MEKKLVSDAQINCEDVATTISSSYDKTDEAKFRVQVMTENLILSTGNYFKKVIPKLISSNLQDS